MPQLTAPCDHKGLDSLVEKLDKYIFTKVAKKMEQ